MPSVEEQNLWPTLKAITAREFEILKMEYNITYPEKVERVIQVGPSIGRTSMRVGSCNTISRSMRASDSQRCRLVLGVEALQMQGIHYGRMHGTASLEDNARLMSLAGNAFNVWCCAASWLSLLVVRGEMYSLNSGQAQSPSGSTDDGSSDSLREPEACVGDQSSTSDAAFFDKKKHLRMC